MEISNEHRMTELEARSKSNTKRLDEFEQRISKIEERNTTLAVLEIRMKALEAKIDELCTRVEVITSKPAKRWDSLVTQAITTLVAACMGFLLAKIGLGG